MRYRLLVNLNAKTKAGSIVTAEDLGERFGQLDAQGFLEVYAGDLDQPVERSAFEAALEAYRLHMEAAVPLIITVMDAVADDNQVVVFADVVRELGEAMPADVQHRLYALMARAHELAEADLKANKDTGVASLSTATAEGAASMGAAPEHNALAADQAEDATNPEGGAAVAAAVVTTSEAQVVASSDGAAAATAASHDTPEAEVEVAPKAPAAKRGGPKKSGAA